MEIGMKKPHNKINFNTKRTKTERKPCLWQLRIFIRIILDYPRLIIKIYRIRTKIRKVRSYRIGPLSETFLKNAIQSIKIYQEMPQSVELREMRWWFKTFKTFCFKILIPVLEVSSTKGKVHTSTKTTRLSRQVR